MIKDIFLCWACVLRTSRLQWILVLRSLKLRTSIARMDYFNVPQRNFNDFLSPSNRNYGNISSIIYGTKNPKVMNILRALNDGPFCVWSMRKRSAQVKCQSKSLNKWDERASTTNEQTTAKMTKKKRKPLGKMGNFRSTHSELIYFLCIPWEKFSRLWHHAGSSVHIGLLPSRLCEAILIFLMVFFCAGIMCVTRPSAT